MTQGSVPAEWFFVPCGPFLTGDIRMDIMPGNSGMHTWGAHESTIACLTIFWFQLRAPAGAL